MEYYIIFKKKSLFSIINLVSKYGLYLDVSVYKGIDKRKNLLKKLSSALIAVELKEILHNMLNEQNDTGVTGMKE